MNKSLNFYKNLSIKSKMAISFIIIIFFSLVLGLIGIINIYKINKSYNKMLDSAEMRTILINDNFAYIIEIRRAMLSVIISKEVIKDEDNFEKQVKIIENSIEIIKDNIDKYNDSIDTDENIDDNEAKECIEISNKIINILDNDFKPSVDKIIKNVSNENILMLNEYLPDALKYSEATNEYLQDLLDRARNSMTEIAQKNNSEALLTIEASFIIILITIFISLILAVFTSKDISKPIKNLSDAANKISNGDFELNLNTQRKDEIGNLSNDMSVIVNVINNLINDINNLASEIKIGNVYKRINENNYTGKYETAAKEINNVAQIFVNDLIEISKGIKAYSKGDFSYICPRMPGKKAVFHESMDKFKENVLLVNNDIRKLVKSASEGVLNNRIDESLFEGDWKELTVSLNELMINIASPVNDVSKALNKISNGNLNASIKNIYKGQFSEMVNNINITTETLTLYINEISDVLSKMAKQNFIITIKNDYKGDFSNIKTALNLIISNLNNLSGSISASSEQIFIGTKQIASSSSDIAFGAQQQAESVEELNITIKSISEQINKNTKDIKYVSELAENTRNDSENGNNQMNNMLNAMSEINEASSNIESIIKVIDDIAFQTNILALNAAVEAARVGENGKGFSVVAEEVRALAVKSQESAKETADLISVSLKKVEQGIKIAKDVADTFKNISYHINEISDITFKTAELSEVQNIAINQITQGTEQISSVIMSNSATSQQTAAISQQLATQTEMFRNMLSEIRFK